MPDDCSEHLAVLSYSKHLSSITSAFVTQPHTDSLDIPLWRLHLCSALHHKPLHVQACTSHSAEFCRKRIATTSMAGAAAAGPSSSEMPPAVTCMPHRRPGLTALEPAVAAGTSSVRQDAGCCMQFGRRSRCSLPLWYCSNPLPSLPQQLMSSRWASTALPAAGRTSNVSSVPKPCTSMHAPQSLPGDG